MLKRNKMQENKRKGQPKGQKLPKGQNSEGTDSEGTEKKREKKRIARQHKLNEGEERKVL